MSKQALLIATALVAASLAALALSDQFSDLDPDPTPDHTPGADSDTPVESPLLQSSRVESIPPTNRIATDQGQADTAVDEPSDLAQKTPRESRVPEGWAGYDMRAEEAAIYRAKKLQECYANFTSWEDDALRTSAAKNTLLNAVFAIMDYERTSSYPIDETGYRIRKRDGYHIMMNGHGIYEWAVGQYPTLDALWGDGFSGPLSDQQVAEIERLYLEATEILAPYAQ